MTGQGGASGPVIRAQIDYRIQQLLVFLVDEDCCRCVQQVALFSSLIYFIFSFLQIVCTYVTVTF